MTLPPETRSVSAARHFLTRTLDDWGMVDYEWVAAQILSELVTNVVLHARTSFTVIVTADDRLLRIEVQDGSTRPPVRRRFGLGATTGRGLALVERLGSGWGVHTGDGGKVVWCEIDPASGGGLDGYFDVEEFGRPDSGVRGRTAPWRRRRAPRGTTEVFDRAAAFDVTSGVA